MNNKKYEIYKEIMISFKNILTQNRNYELEIETITTDEEISIK